MIELIVTIAIIAIALAIAAPSFTAYQRNAELTRTANTLLTTLTNARAEAMKRNLNVYVEPDGTVGSDWRLGWRAYADVNFNQTFDENTDVILSRQPALPQSISIGTDSGASGFVQGDGTYVMFNAAGYPARRAGGFAGGGLELVNSGGSRRVILSAVGRVRVCKPDTDNSCNATSF